MSRTTLTAAQQTARRSDGKFGTTPNVEDPTVSLSGPSHIPTFDEQVADDLENRPAEDHAWTWARLADETSDRHVRQLYATHRGSLGAAMANNAGWTAVGVTNPEQIARAKNLDVTPDDFDSPDRYLRCRAAQARGDLTFEGWLTREGRRVGNYVDNPTLDHRMARPPKVTADGVTFENLPARSQVAWVHGYATTLDAIAHARSTAEHVGGDWAEMPLLDVAFDPPAKANLEPEASTDKKFATLSTHLQGRRRAVAVEQFRDRVDSGAIEGLSVFMSTRLTHDGRVQVDNVTTTGDHLYLAHETATGTPMHFKADAYLDDVA